MLFRSNCEGCRAEREDCSSQQPQQGSALEKRCWRFGHLLQAPSDEARGGQDGEQQTDAAELVGEHPLVSMPQQNQIRPLTGRNRAAVAEPKQGGGVHRGGADRLGRGQAAASNGKRDRKRHGRGGRRARIEIGGYDDVGPAFHKSTAAGVAAVRAKPGDGQKHRGGMARRDRIEVVAIAAEELVFAVVALDDVVVVTAVDNVVPIVAEEEDSIEGERGAGAYGAKELGMGALCASGGAVGSSKAL